jgi:hypothetical protein
MGFWDEFGLEPVTEFWKSGVGRSSVLRTLKHPISVPEACQKRAVPGATGAGTLKRAEDAFAS